MTLNVFKAEDEYKRHADLSKQSVNQMQEWLEKQPHLPKITEEEIIRFLLSCENSVEIAKQTLDLYFTIRTHAGEIFEKRDPLDPQNVQALNTMVLLPLPGTTDNGFKVMYSGFRDPDPAKFHHASFVRCLFMCEDLMLIEEGAHTGIQIIFDLKDITFTHLAKCNPFVVKKGMMYLQDAMPVRLDSFHFINPAGYMGAVMNLIKPFMNKHIAESLRVHQSYEELHKCIPKHVLPKELGGDLPSVEELNVAYTKKVNANRDWFIHEEKTAKVNEKLRPGKAKDSGQIFGVEGSFKKLDID